MKFIFLFCEGPHDVALIYRILKTEGFKSYNRTLGDYPPSIGKFLLSEAKHSSLSDINLQSVGRHLLPQEIIKRDEDTIALLYALGGDGRQNERKKILQYVMDTFSSQYPDALVPGEGHEASIIYLFDADFAGKTARYNLINGELKGICGDDIPLLTSEQPVGNINAITIGGYIFTKIDTDTGKLEDILIPLMRKGNEAIFLAASSLIADHYDEGRCFKLKISIRNNLAQEERSRNKLKFDYQKSLIGIVGQLQNSGKANNPIIRDTDFINLDKIQNDHSCMKIIDFLRFFI